MDKKKLEKKLLEFLAAKATEMQGQDQESIDYSTNIEELADCTFLLQNGLSDDAIISVANQNCLRPAGCLPQEAPERPLFRRRHPEFLRGDNVVHAVVEGQGHDHRQHGRGAYLLCPQLAPEKAPRRPPAEVSLL